MQSSAPEEKVVGSVGVHKLPVGFVDHELQNLWNYHISVELYIHTRFLDPYGLVWLMEINNNFNPLDSSLMAYMESQINRTVHLQGDFRPGYHVYSILSKSNPQWAFFLVT